MIKKKKKKNRILITLCAMFLAVASVFAFIPFTKNDTLVVKADDTSYNSTFTGSNLNFVISGFGSAGVNNFSDLISEDYLFMSYRFRLNFDNGVLSSYYNAIFNSSNYLYNGSNDLGVDGFNLFGSYNYNSPISYHYRSYVKGNSSVETLLAFSFYNEAGDYSKAPTLTMTNVIFSNYKELSGLDDNPLFMNDSVRSGYFNFISYLDTAGYRYNFFIPSCYQNYYSHSRSPYYYFNFRTYSYFNSDEFEDNFIYQQGKLEGTSIGYQEGYDKGYDLGYDFGYNSGYTEGAEDTNQYTFLNLVSATIDAPIKYFQSLFNFELLGVNLQGFLTGLFTLCVIVTIIKMVL